MSLEELTGMTVSETHILPRRSDGLQPREFLLLLVPRQLDQSDVAWS